MGVVYEDDFIGRRIQAIGQGVVKGRIALFDADAVAGLDEVEGIVQLKAVQGGH